jgi:hypothetical protein
MPHCKNRYGSEGMSDIARVSDFLAFRKPLLSVVCARCIALPVWQRLAAVAVLSGS